LLQTSVRLLNAQFGVQGYHAADGCDNYSFIVDAGRFGMLLSKVFTGADELPVALPQGQKKAHLPSPDKCALHGGGPGGPPRIA
jgi:hypothetical protein